jgi:hypothetical protein
MRSSTLTIIVLAVIFQSAYARPVGGSQSGDMLPVDVTAPVNQPRTDTGRSGDQTTGDVGGTGTKSPGNDDLKEFEGLISGPAFVSDSREGSGPGEDLPNLPVTGLVENFPIDIATGAIAGAMNVVGF